MSVENHNEASAAVNRSVLAQYTDRYFGKYLKDESINEIVFNGGNKIWWEDVNSDWHFEERSDFNDTVAWSFATTVASFKKDDINQKKPILSGILTGGERIQIVSAPVTKGNFVSITIRKPSKVRYTIENYISSGIIDQNLADMLKNFIAIGKNLVICGETGSGKTTFMKTLIDFIPLEQRLITIEDVEEIRFWNHKNYVQLFYPSEAKPGDPVTSAKLLKSCLRMKPDRILLAEVRGGETYDFINVISSGHNGSMTSCHAGSVSSCLDRLVMMSMQNDEAKAVGKEMLLDMIHKTIDVIVVLKKVNKRRMVTEYYLDGVTYRNDGNGNFERVD